jgi:hypothetical protein
VTGSSTTRATVFTSSLLTLLACTSPEALRTRGGGPGADIGNRGDTVEFHAGANPYHDTPCVTTLATCDGPQPVFGPTATRD